MEDRRKDTGNFITKYIKSFKHGLDGINYAIEKEKNLIVMMIISLIALVLCFIFKVTTIELIAVIICTSILFALELVNCSIEATVDLYSIKESKLAKIAKDCSTGAILVSSILSIIVIGVILIPKIIDKL